MKSDEYARFYITVFLKGLWNISDKGPPDCMPVRHRYLLYMYTPSSLSPPLFSFNHPSFSPQGDFYDTEKIVSMGDSYETRPIDPMGVLIFL